MSTTTLYPPRRFSLQKITRPGNFVWFIFTLLLIICLLSSPFFFTARNLKNVFLIQSIGLSIVTLAQVLIIISGNIDMSVGAAVSLLTTLAAGLFRDLPGIDPFLVAVIIISAGLLIGGLNAFLTVILRIPSFMGTLATMSLLQGLIFFYTKTPIGGIPKSFRLLAKYKIAGIPVCFIYFLLIFGIVALIIRKHRFGTHLYAVGSDSYIAEISGIAVRRVKIYAFLLAGSLVSFAAIFLASRMAGGGPTTGSGYELDTITAAVIGGVSLSGGEGTLLGAIGGVLILTIFSNLMNLLNISSYIQMLLKGLILIIAVSFYAKKNNE